MSEIDLNSLKILTDGSLPLLSAVYDQLEIGEIIDQTVTWDKDKCDVSPGIAMKALILNMIISRRPLYLIQEFYRDKDIEKLFGEGISLEQINEFSIGRSLEKVYNANAKVLYSTIALKTMDIEDIVLKTIHWDTTSKNLSGNYDVYSEEGPNEETPVHITYGYSKDKRFDLKQIKFGTAVVPEKIPLFADVLSGNIDDKSWNGDVIEQIAGSLKYLNLQDVIHVADSALVTKENLLSMNDEEYTFISRLPATFGLEKDLINRSLNQKDEWIQLNQVTGTKEGASYQVQEIEEQLYGKPYRFLICHSNHLDYRKQKTLQSKIEEEEKKITKQLKKMIHQEGYSCESDAVAASNKIKDRIRSRYHRLETSTTIHEVQKKYKKRGRPPKNVSPEFETKYFITVQITPDDQVISKKEKEAGLFVLITNQLDKEKLTTEEILLEYKNQYSVESTFRMLKSPSYVDAIFLKKPERIGAFGYMMVVGVLLLNVIERRIRIELSKDEAEPIQLTGRRMSKNPTISTILQVFEHVKVVKVLTLRNNQRMIAEALTDNQKRILKLCGVDENIYVKSGKILETIR